MSERKFHIENVDEEIEIEICFDYQPEEKQTWDYPGCSAGVEINEVTRVDNGAELCLLPREQESIEEQLVIQSEENREAHNQYKRYGYLLDY